MSLIHLKNITVLDPASEWYGKKTDLFIESGIITDIADAIEDRPGATVVEGENLYVTVGWVDLRANFCDPGFEHKEDIYSGIEAAAYGGFTGVAVLPETDPVLATKSAIEYVRRKAEGNVVDVYPLGALTTDKDQENLTEMYDVSAAGARGFSSGYKPVNNNGFLLRAMEYAGMTGMPLMIRAENKSISGKGMINEGAVSVRLGLKGIPGVAEESDIRTILSLCEYTGQPIHISCVSTRVGMQLIEEARKTGLEVTADVSIHHLYFEESDLGMFDTNLKLRPPLRTVEDRDYLREAVLRDKFVSVVSDHSPHETDKKLCEFELAAYGATGLQTLFSQMLAIYSQEKLEDIIEILGLRPRKVLGLNYAPIVKGSAANLTVFNPELTWTLDEKTNKSKSSNSPLWRMTLKGKAVAIINNGLIKKLD